MYNGCFRCGVQTFGSHSSLIPYAIHRIVSPWIRTGFFGLAFPIWTLDYPLHPYYTWYHGWCQADWRLFAKNPPLYLFRARSKPQNVVSAAPGSALVCCGYTIRPERWMGLSMVMKGHQVGGRKAQNCVDVSIIKMKAPPIG